MSFYEIVEMSAYVLLFVFVDVGSPPKMVHCWIFMVRNPNKILAKEIHSKSGPKKIDFPNPG